MYVIFDFHCRFIAVLPTAIHSKLPIADGNSKTRQNDQYSKEQPEYIGIDGKISMYSNQNLSFVV